MKKITTVILIVHILLLMLVVLFNSKFNLQGKGLVAISILAIFFFMILTSMKYRRFYLAVIVCSVAYFILNALVLSFFLFSSAPPDKPQQSIIFLSFFLPGLISSLSLSIILFRQRKAIINEKKGRL